MRASRSFSQSPVRETCRRRYRARCRDWCSRCSSTDGLGFTGPGTRGRHAQDLGQTEVENFCVSAIGFKQIGGLDIAMNNAFGVSGIESDLGYFNGG